MYGPNVPVRESAAKALHAVLQLLSKRQNSDKWFAKLWDKCLKGIRNNPETLHGSLLVLGELLLITDTFRERHFKESCDKILKLKVKEKQKKQKKPTNQLINHHLGS